MRTTPLINERRPYLCLGSRLACSLNTNPVNSSLSGVIRLENKPAASAPAPVGATPLLSAFISDGNDVPIWVRAARPIRIVVSYQILTGLLQTANQPFGLLAKLTKVCKKSSTPKFVIADPKNSGLWSPLCLPNVNGTRF